MKREDELNKTIRKTINDTLSQIFGHTAVLIIYNHLEKNNSLPPEEIPRNLDAFARGIEDFLDSGALVVEKIILRHLYSGYGFKFKEIEKNCSFVDHIIQLKSIVNENMKITSET